MKKSKRKAWKKIEEKETQEPVIVFLSFPAFLTIVSSSVEVFKKETIGYLVGFKGTNKYIVEYAIPFQTADHGFAHATVDMDRVGRINEILRKVSQGLEYVGDFHSHTVFGDSPGTVVPSDEDLRSTIPGEVNLICAVNMKRRAVRWYQNGRGILAGTIGDYRIEIGGYYVEAIAIGRKYQRVIVECPAVTGIAQIKD